MIGLDVGLWSGFKRKMEIAESFAQPIVVVSIIVHYLLAWRLLFFFHHDLGLS
jgi:hypothetical protein